MALTPKQQRFVEEYLVDLNATAAYKRAGYACKNDNAAAASASALLRNPKIVEAIAARQAKRSEDTGITAARVLQELARLALLDVRGFYRTDGTLKFPRELNDDQAAALASLEVLEEFDGSGENRYKIGEVRKVKFWNKPRALQLLAQHLGMLVEKHEHTGKNGGPIESNVKHDITLTATVDRYADSVAEILAARAAPVPIAAPGTGLPSPNGNGKPVGSRNGTGKSH